VLPKSTLSIDESLWPLRVARFEGIISSQQFEDYLEKSSACLHRGQQYVSIMDFTHGGPPPFDQRQRQAAWIREHEQLLRQWSLGVAFVITSPIVRLAVSASLYWQPLPVPYLLTPRMSEATNWAIQRLEEAKLFPAAERIRHHLQTDAARNAAPSPPPRS
jgi:hypothetical protein